MLGRLIGVVVRNPFGVLAAALVVGSWGAISVNAMWMQDGPHPAPFLGREALTGIPAKLPPAKPERRVSELSPGGAEDAERRRVIQKQMEQTRALQIELARRNYYTGSIDGQFGPRTELAIRDYQRAAGLAETGQPSGELLAHVQLSTLNAPPQPVPSPLRPEPVAIQPNSDPADSQTTGSLAPAGDPVAALIAKAEPVTPQPAPPPESAPLPLPKAEPASQAPAVTRPAADPRTEAVQSILADLGYAPGSIDGTLSPATRRAIEDFEVDRGLPMTGRISPQLLQELTAVSGVPLG
jgi:peptidoglycan hydrolase-like protein with peptidoglycan-binding domain